ncbi:MAG TPA: pyruvate kinase [Burkholderiaceae bacterium]|nr:pyruvate kinase [Burkholderiaceae bacterium]
MNATRSTKIVATLGPASSSADVLQRMLAAGVDVVRLNFSHGKPEDHIGRAKLVRDLARGLGREVAIMADLQGPKIRVGKFADGKVDLAPEARFVLDAECELGDVNRVGLDYKDLPRDVKVGDVLLLNDGLIVLDIEHVTPTRIETVVRIGGELSNNKGINKQGGGLSAPALTAKDVRDIETAMELGADFVAVSFVRNRTDVEMARQLANIAGERFGHKPQIIAKIERAEAIPALPDILQAADGVMVARGDLAVEVGNAAVPALQKRMIRMARDANKLAITATQMMESMIVNAIPTRAEVSDVANAVLDGTDAVMLSAETAAGKHPVEVVETMAAVVAEADRSETVKLDREFLDQTFIRVDQSIAYGALFTGYHLRCKAICALTESGSTALWMSRHDINMPIFALTQTVATQRRLALYRNVFPVFFPMPVDRETALATAEQILVDQGRVSRGDLIVITCGEPMGQPGGTNSLTIVHVGQRA